MGYYEFTKYCITVYNLVLSSIIMPIATFAEVIMGLLFKILNPYIETAIE